MVNTYDPFFEPCPNIEQWFYYFDAGTPWHGATTSAALWRIGCASFGSTLNRRTPGVACIVEKHAKGAA